MKAKKYWAGFCNGKIDDVGITIILYTNKVAAKRVYEDVRPVRIVEVKE